MKAIVIIEIVIMLIISIFSGYAIGKSKREVYQKDKEINELKNEFRNYKK